MCNNNHKSSHKQTPSQLFLFYTMQLETHDAACKRPNDNKLSTNLYIKSRGFVSGTKL